MTQGLRKFELLNLCIILMGSFQEICQQISGSVSEIWQQACIHQLPRIEYLKPRQIEVQKPLIEIIPTSYGKIFGSQLAFGLLAMSLNYNVLVISPLKKTIKEQVTEMMELNILPVHLSRNKKIHLREISHRICQDHSRKQKKKKGCQSVSVKAVQ